MIPRVVSDEKRQSDVQKFGAIVAAPEVLQQFTSHTNILAYAKDGDVTLHFPDAHTVPSTEALAAAFGSVQGSRIAVRGGETFVTVRQDVFDAAFKTSLE